MTTFQGDGKKNDIDERCENCGHRFYDHHNGQCPTDESDAGGSQ